jgi:hypothetical protein
MRHHQSYSDADRYWARVVGLRPAQMPDSKKTPVTRAAHEGLARPPDRSRLWHPINMPLMEPPAGLRGTPLRIPRLRTPARELPIAVCAAQPRAGCVERAKVLRSTSGKVAAGAFPGWPLGHP